MSTDDTNPAAANPVDAASLPTDDDRDFTHVPAGPPWTLDVVGDVHAGRYPPEVTGRLRRLIADDPWAASVLTALDATVDQLSLLPTPRMPERFALRLDAAIASEYRAAAGGPAAVVGASSPAGDQVVPQPRQGVDQSVSALPTRAQQVAGGRPLQQRRPPSSVGSPPVLPPPPFIPPPPASPLPTSPDAPRPSTGPSAAHSESGPATAGQPGPAWPTGQAGHAASPMALQTGPYGAPVASLAAARARRRRWIGGLAAAAAVIGIGSATIASLNDSPDTGGVAAASSSAPAAAPAPGGGNTNALQLDPGRFGDALTQIEGRRPVGSLQDAATYARCLAANAIDPSAVSGVTSATFAGKPAVAIAVTVDAGHSRVVVVGPDCGVGGVADQLAAQTVTR